MSDESSYRRPSSEELLSDLRRALMEPEGCTDGDIANLDYRRGERTGTPEIIFAENKTPDQVLTLVQRMIKRNGSVLVSRVTDDTLALVRSTFTELEVEQPSGAAMIRVARADSERRGTSGRMAIFTAGTSDLARAHEVRLVAGEMGVEARIWADIGVAGLHRLIQPFREAIDWGATVIVVVAGMDGALPSVISGLSPVPVIGLPVSVGYGFGGRGEGALMTMLQTCAPGLTVVNIDNSVGAGIAAARIARQSAG